MADERGFLEAAFRLASRSLIAFLGENRKPAPGEERLASVVLRQAEVERDHADEIRALLRDAGVEPAAGPFPESFERVASLSAAAPHVVLDLRSQRDELERIFARFMGDVAPEVLNAVVSLRDERVRLLAFWERESAR
ncbi:hypothetical protein HY251_01125 [bacterium]|nr:hypothetical protein [bacterium]